MKKIAMITLIALPVLMFSCKSKKNQPEPQDTFKYKIDQFADLKIMAYQIPGFDQLTPKQKELVYYLSQAALAGRDILYDQNYKHNLTIKRTLENIVETYKGNRETDDFKKFMVYVKRFWFSNGIHHHYSNDKFIPECSAQYFAEIFNQSDKTKFPYLKDETPEQFLARITPLIFDPNVASKRLILDAGKDLVQNSATNFYEGVTQKEVDDFYAKLGKPKEEKPLSYGLNSKVVKENGKVVEKVWKIDGMYGPAIQQIVYWLEKAVSVAENAKQKAWLEKLIEYYKTGDLKTWDEYNILWVEDQESDIDVVNGFIEVYGDPLARKATWEAVVNFKDKEATKRALLISQNAQWFEDHSPVAPQFKKKEVKGVSAKVITVAQLGGDCYPSTPIGINLPNAEWIRKIHGSKSVTMENITYAYDQAAIGNGLLEEFCYDAKERELQEKYGFLAGNVHTDLHECLGHGSGQLLPTTNPDALKNYHSALEESRADLFALYYIMDPKMVELGVLPNLDAAKAEYNAYIRNGLMTQLTRIELGKDIQQAHMRCRSLIAHWAYEKGKAENVIEKKVKDGKTYFVINDYQKLRNLFGQLLAEIQRIKSEGDFEAGKNLVETYGVKVDPVLHKEVKERYAKLNLAPYGGFVNPVLVPVEKDGKIIDVKVEYTDDYVKQMMEYAKKFSFLPVYN